MINEYQKQAELLVSVLPHIAKETCFALKGGTAINLFVRDMPRLSVDIDLQYICIDDRETAFSNINSALDRIAKSLEKVGIKSFLRENEYKIRKMICSNEQANIKIEPNYIIRGCIKTPELMQTSPKVQDSYGFAAINVLSFGELFGGKICAALDRQHPRDLFDVKLLLENEGFNERIKEGFFVALLGHNRPPYEILKPNIQNHEEILQKEFFGMIEDDFSYKDHVETLCRLINTVNAIFTERDKQFLLGFFSAAPQWDLLKIENLQNLPAIKWKLQNLEQLKSNNEEKFKVQLHELRKVLI